VAHPPHPGPLPRHGGEATASEPTSLFRDEALAHYTQGYRFEGDLIRLSPAWLTWTAWLLLAAGIAATLFAIFGTIHEYATGPAIVRAEGRRGCHHTRNRRQRRSARRRGTMPCGMPTLADVFRVLNEMRSAGRIDQYAIGGATAVLFYAEPARTYDLDVFVILPAAETGLPPLSGVYEWTGARGFSTLGEHVLIYGVPVQFLPAHNPLVEEAIAEARDLEYEDVKVRVVGPEHLVALALHAGGARRRERAWQLVEAGQLDRDRLRALLARHGISVEIPDDV